MPPAPLSLSTAIVAKFRIIVDLCNNVARGLGKGRAECVYQEALCMELQEAMIPHSKEETIPILYKGVSVGHERLDIGIRKWLDMILELKAVMKNIDESQLWQVHSYMDYKRCDYGAVINFSQSMGDTGVEIAFIVKVDGASYVYQLETGLAILMKGNGFNVPLLDGKIVSDAVASFEKEERARANALKKAVEVASKALDTATKAVEAADKAIGQATTEKANAEAATEKATTEKASAESKLAVATIKADKDASKKAVEAAIKVVEKATIQKVAAEKAIEKANSQKIIAEKALEKAIAEKEAAVASASEKDVNATKVEESTIISAP